MKKKRVTYLIKLNRTLQYCNPSDIDDELDGIVIAEPQMIFKKTQKMDTLIRSHGPLFCILNIIEV
jgi:hypothetical protein